MPKYVMYDSDMDALVTTRTWDTYEDALVDLDDRLTNVIIVPLGVGDGDTEEDDQPRKVEFIVMWADHTWETVVHEVPRSIGHDAGDLIKWAENNLGEQHYQGYVAFALYNSDVEQDDEAQAAHDGDGKA